MPSKADVKAWKAQLVAQAEQQILKLTDSDRFKQYLNTLSKFHHYSARNIDLIYAQNPQATQVAGFKQWQTAFNRTVNRGEKAIRIAAPIIKKLTPAEKKRLDTTDERAIVGYRYLPVFDVSQTSGEPVLSAKDFVKENLADHQNVTSLYNAFKDYLINISRKSRDFSHGMDRPLLSPFMGLFVCFCIFLVIDIFLDNFFAHIAQCTHMVTRRPKMTAPILATSYFWMIL